MLTTPIADRRVEDRFLEMTSAERALYDAVEEYIASTYNQASANERTAVGFVMTIYRRRLASSFSALRHTLQNHLDAMVAGNQAPLMGLDEDAPDDEAVPSIYSSARTELAKLLIYGLFRKIRVLAQDGILTRIWGYGKWSSKSRLRASFGRGDARMIAR